VTYAFTDNLSEESLLQAAAAASAAAKGSSKPPLVDLTKRKSAWNIRSKSLLIP